MRLADDVRKAIRTGLFITAASVVGSFTPVYVWLAFNPVIDIHTVYFFSVMVPMAITPFLSFFQLRAQVHAERLAAENYRLANIDDLTGLPNRRAFFAEAAKLRQQADEQGKAQGAVLVCGIADIDDFKRVNDRHGHDTGDEVLRAVAHSLREIGPERGLIARLGGEEFAIAGLFPDERAARTLCERLVRLVSRRGFARPGVQLGLTISLGFTKAVEGDTVSTLLSRADQALYHAKQTGKNRAVEFSAMDGEADIASLQAIAATMASAG